jgi:putative endonuclease
MPRRTKPVAAAPARSDAEPGWQVYLLRCADGSLYTGIARDAGARLADHNAGRGAKYTRGRRPVTLVYTEAAADRAAALKREHAIKQLPRAAKHALIAAGPGILR